MTEEAVVLERPRVPELDAILGARINVLDDGFVRVVDYMGSDCSIVQAARVSYGEGTRQVNEDRGLIRYLMRHRHTTPFEMCELKLHVRAPMDVWRQWIRHRTASVNEYSTRYSVAIDATQRTSADEWRSQSSMNKQGSASGNLPTEIGTELSREEAALLQSARSVYEARLKAGVAREQARKDLPLSTYTEAYWKIDLHNLLHFLSLRMGAHAQQEIRTYAQVIASRVVSLWCPLAWEAFVDYRLDSIELSTLDRAVLAAICNGDPARARQIAHDAGLLNATADGTLKANRERTELESKLEKLGVRAPWIA